MDKYYTVKVKISEESLQEYLCEYCDEETVTQMDLDDECVEALNDILQDHLSHFYVIGKNTLFLGDM